MANEKECPKCATKMVANPMMFALPQYATEKLGADMGNPSVNVYRAAQVAMHSCPNQNCRYVELYRE
jgi:hypothetical protein